MRNPLRDEEAAFRIVLWTIAYFVPIVVASRISAWLGLAVFFLETVAVAVLIRRAWTAGGTPSSGADEEPAAVADTVRILVLGGVGLRETPWLEAVETAAAGLAEDVLVVGVASPGGALTDRARVESDVADALARLEQRGLRARGRTVEARDRAALLEETLAGFAADEIVQVD